ncbi:MAG: hypothetical protein EPN65_10220 [Pandoraea sp.]|uniref:hypothetical protein n=1 Tax=Pandoraea sp. TaxID=1883445 RepID=UPI00121244B7|nr:hypothetical protein [Pandoraea sp.]TAM17562.1 MAG: hypothetical protein EPN65_10220 [Pandoraea sp.]
MKTKSALSKLAAGEGAGLVALEFYRRTAELAPDASWEILERDFLNVTPLEQESRLALLDSVIRAAARALSQHDEAAAAPSAEVIAAESTDPLQAARDRGRHWATEEWNAPANLTLNDAANYAGRSDRMINEERQSGRLYALLPMGKMRGYRYPQWQFDAEPSRLAAALSPFTAHGASCWVIHNFMKRPSEALDGLTPQTWILDSTRPIDSVVRLAEGRYQRDQGAQ